MVIRMADGLCEELWVVESQRLKERDDNHLIMCGYVNIFVAHIRSWVNASQYSLNPGIWLQNGCN